MDDLIQFALIVAITLAAHNLWETRKNNRRMKKIMDELEQHLKENQDG